MLTFLRRLLFTRWVEASLMPQELRGMFLRFARSPSFRMMSAYWRLLARETTKHQKARNYYHRHFRPRHMPLFENLFKDYETLYTDLLHRYVTETLGYEGEPKEQDRLTALVDYEAVRHLTPASILEVGAGDGRTARVLIEKLRPKSYVIVDIPPALFYVQQLQREFSDVEFSFLLPHELFDLSEQFDLIVAIDCLHEMDRTQVDRYLQHFAHHGSYFYMKAWIKTRSLFYQRGEYSCLSGWQVEFDRECVFPKGYFERLERRES